MKTIISGDILQAATLLTNGNIIGIPTETVYGLAANALNIDAVAEIFKVKDRPFFDPLIVHIPGIGHIEKYAIDIPESALRLAEKFWPGPLTLVLKRKSIIPDLVTSGLDTVGLRVPSHDVTLCLLQALDFPLAAPSANPFGYISPTTSMHVMDQLQGKIPLILEGGASSVGVESTIVQCTGDDIKILRLGGICVEDVESVVGFVTIESHAAATPAAPGQLSLHYSPRKKMIIGNIEELLQKFPGASVLSYSTRYDGVLNRVLSERSDLTAAAANLFGMMRELDNSHSEIILAEFVPETGLGRAINDRLRRAAAAKN